MTEGTARQGLAGAVLADRLVADGLVRKEMRDRAVGMHRRTDKRIEECLLELAAIGEAELLRYLAGLYRTRFVSTEKLARADIDPATLAKLPRKLADRYHVAPVLFEAAANALCIVTADPDNVDALDQIQKGAGVREVRALVARPAAVEATIRRLYDRDPLAFAAFERPRAGQVEFGELVAGGAELSQALSLDVLSDSPATAAAFPVSGRMGVARKVAPEVEPPKRPVPPPAPPRAKADPTPVHAPTDARLVLELGPIGGERGRGPHSDRVFASSALSPRAEGGPPAPSAATSTNGAADVQTARDREASARREWTTSNAFIETLNVLITLLENGRAELRGHSAQVARFTRKMAERIGLPSNDVNALVVAAYLHDVGKAAGYHLTSLNASEYDGPRTGAQKSYANPHRLLQNLKLAPLTVSALESMYERPDGNGFPDQRSGKEIPLGARLLALADTFVDLTANAKNPFRRVLKPAEACDVLQRYKHTVFDAGLLDLVRATVAGDDVRARLLSDRPLVLLIDPDPEETTVLELRMVEQGFEVRVARSAEQARKVLESEEVELVVAELDLGDAGEDGLALLESIRATEKGRSLPWFVLTSRKGGADAERAYALSAMDYLLKPAPAELLVAKLKQALATGSGAKPQNGVAGSLSEMGIPDLVQILFYGRKSGGLHIRRGNEAAAIFFADGMVVDAAWGKRRGEDVFYEIIKMREGEFTFDPASRAEQTSITTSPESLLLEGLRRMDESENSVVHSD